MVATDETKKQTKPEQNVQSEDKKGKKKKDKKKKVRKPGVYISSPHDIVALRAFESPGGRTLRVFKKVLSLSVCKWLDDNRLLHGW